MRRALLILGVFLGLRVAAAPQPVRNPFWPVGYEGERTVISPVPRVQKALAPAPEPVKKESAQPVVQDVPKPTGAATVAEWTAARAQIKVGVVMRARNVAGANERASVIFNGKVCNVGEEVAIESQHRRYVWRFEGIGKGGVVKLVRVRTEDVAPKTAGESAKELFNFIKNKIKE